MLLDREDIIKRITELNLPMHSYVVFGSGPLAAAGIRKTQDIDLIVSKPLFEKLKNEGWKQHENENGAVLVKDEFEVCHEIRYKTYRPRFEDLLRSVDIIKGIPFVNLHDIRKWKQVMSRPKDHRDIEMIDDYLARLGWS